MLSCWAFCAPKSYDNLEKKLQKEQRKIHSLLEMYTPLKRRKTEVKGKMQFTDLEVNDKGSIKHIEEDYSVNEDIAGREKQDLKQRIPNEERSDVISKPNVRVNAGEICSNLKQNPWVHHTILVRKNNKGDILILCYTTRDNMTSETETISGVTVLYKHFKTCSRESLAAEKSMLAQNRGFTEKEMHTLNSVMSTYTHELMLKHSNLEMIGMSTIRSTSHGYEPEPCIVLYCRCKSYVPLGEEPFPADLVASDGTVVKTDVREGYFMLCPTGGISNSDQSREWKKELSIGHSIGPEDKLVGATLGIFVEVHAQRHYNGFITASHLFFDDPANADSNVNKNVVQPATGETQTRQITRDRTCGTIRACLFDADGEVGVDAALVEIVSDRMPTRATFVEVSGEALDKAGFHEMNYPTFDDGSTKDATKFKVEDFATERVIKFGKQTGLTKGSFQLKQMAVKITGRESEPLHMYNRAYVMRGQLVIDSPIDSLFFQAGDSGASVFQVDKNNKLNYIGKAIGITTDGLCIVTPVKHILEKLGSKLGAIVSIKRFDTGNEMNM